MLHYVGLDVSMKTTFICILDKEGKVVLQDNVPTDPTTISTIIENSGLKIEKIALESGSISHWLVQELCARKLPTICIDARRMSVILSTNINKTDKNDARLIAEAVRCGFYSEVHQKKQDLVELKILINSRRTLKNTSTQLKNTIRGHLKAFGIRLGTIGNSKFAPKVREIIAKKHPMVQMGIEALLTTFMSIEIKLKQIENYLKDLARKDEDVILLKTIAGVGLITAFTFLVYLGDRSRFKNSRCVGAYFGMTPRQYASGETQIQGRISKQGSSEVRFLLTEAASVILYRTKSWSKLKAWGLKLKKRKGHKKATLAVGRKLCTIMFRMLESREEFKYTEEKDIKKEKSAAIVANKDVKTEIVNKDIKTKSTAVAIA
jgi:transposase